MTKAQLILKANKLCIQLRKIGAKHDKAIRPLRKAYLKSYRGQDAVNHRANFEAYHAKRFITLNGKKTAITKICQSSPVFKVGDVVVPTRNRGNKEATQYIFVTPVRHGSQGGYIVLNSKTGKMATYGLISKVHQSHE